MAVELVPPSDDAPEATCVTVDDDVALVPPSDDAPVANRLTVADAVALVPPSDDAPVAFIGNGEPSKPTVASSSWDVFSVNLLNAIGELTCES